MLRIDAASIVTRMHDYQARTDWTIEQDIGDAISALFMSAFEPKMAAGISARRHSSLPYPTISDLLNFSNEALSEAF
jgi:hypothetical protein